MSTFPELVCYGDSSFVDSIFEPDREPELLQHTQTGAPGRG